MDLQQSFCFIPVQIPSHYSELHTVHFVRFKFPLTLFTSRISGQSNIIGPTSLSVCVSYVMHHLNRLISVCVCLNQKDCTLDDAGGV